MFDARRRGGVALLVVFAAVGFTAWGLRAHARSSRTVPEVVRALDGTAGARMRAALAASGAPARPRRLWLVGLKEERRLELWTESPAGARVRVTAWPVLAASGGPGPKLREGDLQVPEGIYRLAVLNPNSAYHLSLGLDYPNAEDRAHARAEGRTRPGGQIFIHGKAVSIGCLAIGDPAVEELFWLAGTVGREPFTVILAPADLRLRPAPAIPAVSWAPELYRALRDELTAVMGPPRPATP